MKRTIFFYVLLILFTFHGHIHTQAQSDGIGLQQWKDLKYSMFIHWGIYSVLGGVWDGKPVARGLSEQIQAHAGIYSDTYAAVAKQFNPLQWNADSIVLLAKAAGMRSVVITSKHHDGFCMFHSAYTDFNVVDATPFKRDVLKELSDACKKHGLKFGIYFSLIDWHYPQASPISSHNSDNITPEHSEYNKKQVTELLTNYGAVSELWFDMGSQSTQQSKELRDLVHRLQPNCLVSSRIGNDMGDFTVMGDNQEPDYKIGVPWQSPASFFDETWGYRSWQERGSEAAKANQKLASLIKVVSRGGNYLLNIGPKGDGSVVDFEKNVLLKTGRWLQKNAEAIYGTQPDPFQVAFDWGNITTRNNKLYLHLLAAPKEGIITLPGLKGNVKKVYILSDNTKGQFAENASGMTIRLPKGLTITDEYKVVVVEFKDGYTVTPPHTISGINNKISLTSNNAFKYYSSSCIDYNARYQSTVKESWVIAPDRKASYTPSLYFSEEEKGKAIDLAFNDKESTVRLEGGEVVKLENDPSAIQWSPVYLSGPFWSGVEGVAGATDKIEVTKPWPNANDKPWIQQAWQHGKTYELPAEAMTAYYVLQEITSSKAQPLLIQITSGDGILVVVNGKEQLIHLNPGKEKSVQDVLLIQLKEGKNQVLVKLFNNFQKRIAFAISQAPQQVLYHKKLSPVDLQPGKLYPVSWRLHEPVTPHQNLLLPNVLLEFKGN